MLLLHALLFSVLTSTVVGHGTPRLEIEEFPYHGEWYRVPSTLGDCARFLHPSALSWNDNLYRNDAMKTSSRIVDFGRLNTILGRRAMMPGDITHPYPRVPHAYLDHESRERVFGTWRRMPSSRISPGDRLVELVIWPGEHDSAIWIQVMQAQVIIPTSHNSVSSVLTGIFRSKEFSPPDITGAFYRVSSEDPYRDDVIVFKPGRLPGLYTFSSGGNIRYLADHIPPKRFVGAWCRWPKSDHHHNLLAFWLDQGTLKYVINPAVTKRKIGEAKMHNIIEVTPPPPSYDNSHH